MSKKKFISNLSSILADIRKLDAKKIVLDNKDIIDHIKENVPVIKHSQDTRETITENDLWGLWVETKDDGTIIIHDDWVTNPNASSFDAWLSNVKAVQDNKAYSEVTTDADSNFTGVVLDSFVANIQTERIKDGYRMFYATPITSFSGDLSSLVNGLSMFRDTSLTSFNGDLSSLVNGDYMFTYIKLTSFDGDLSSLTNGNYMFNGTSLTSFSGDLSNLTNGNNMFFYSIYLKSFSGDLSSLVNGFSMFHDTKLTSFNGDLSSLVNGLNMFYDTKLTSFNGDLSSLVNGTFMFYKCNLTPQYVMYIVESIKNITEEKSKYTSGEIPWVTLDSTTRKYSASFGFMEDGKYVYTYNKPESYTDTITAASVGKLTLGINVTNDPDTIAQLLQTFALGCLYESWDKLVQAFEDKGWTVTFQYGGTSKTITLPDEGA